MNDCIKATIQKVGSIEERWLHITLATGAMFFQCWNLFWQRDGMWQSAKKQRIDGLEEFVLVPVNNPKVIVGVVGVNFVNYSLAIQLVVTV